MRAPSWAGRRPRVPDGALYQSGGAWLQTIGETWRGRLTLVGNLRYSLADYSSRAQANLWPDDSMRTHAVTARVGAVAAVAQGWHLFAGLSHGFRAPHITDLGTLGLTGSGFEVAAPDLAGFGTTVAQVKPETSLNYEGGARYRTQRVNAELIVFWNDLRDAITKQPLILPPGAVGRALGGETIVAQNPDGTVLVAASSGPVLLRTNLGDARVRGAEGRFRVHPARHWDATLGLTYVHAADSRTGLPPDIEGGTPAPNGYLKVRYTPGGRRFWTEFAMQVAARQSRLSSLDLQDRRTGAMRTRSSIAQFFRNGATARGLVRGGVLLATGETLAQVQDRVLGPGVQAAPLFPALPGYALASLRAGWQIRERHSIFVELENLGDRNYREISWGLDAPGCGIFLRYCWTY